MPRCGQGIGRPKKREDERWDPEEQFDIEVIHDRRRRGGRYQYLVEFTGFPDHKDWYWTDEGQLHDENGGMYPLLVDYLKTIGGNRLVCISINVPIEYEEPVQEVIDLTTDPMPMGEGTERTPVIGRNMEDTVQALSGSPSSNVRPKRKAKGKPKGKPRAKGKRSRKKKTKFD